MDPNQNGVLSADLPHHESQMQSLIDLILLGNHSKLSEFGRKVALADSFDGFFFVSIMVSRDDVLPDRDASRGAGIGATFVGG